MSTSLSYTSLLLYGKKKHLVRLSLRPYLNAKMKSGKLIGYSLQPCNQVVEIKLKMVKSDILAYTQACFSVIRSVRYVNFCATSLIVRLTEERSAVEWNSFNIQCCVYFQMSSIALKVRDFL